jgi:hypothetical protein
LKNRAQPRGKRRNPREERGGGNPAREESEHAGGVKKWDPLKIERGWKNGLGWKVKGDLERKDGSEGNEFGNWRLMNCRHEKKERSAGGWEEGYRQVTGYGLACKRCKSERRILKEIGIGLETSRELEEEILKRVS